jgi:hypothetical protein
VYIITINKISKMAEYCKYLKKFRTQEAKELKSGKVWTGQKFEDGYPKFTPLTIEEYEQILNKRKK